MKKVLLTRFGGIGDVAPITAVAKQLKKKDWEVTFAVREDGPKMRLSDMFIENPVFDRVLNFRQIGPWNSRCVENQFGFATINSIYPDFDLVIDFMNAIENNNTSPLQKGAPGFEWEASRNSNWQNWYDLHLAWANIDPTSVPDEEKRPQYNLLSGEKDQFLQLKKGNSPLIVIQTSASSLSRTWYQAKALPKMIFDKYPNAVIVGWEAEANLWVMMKKEGTTRLSYPEAYSPLRFSMGLVASADLFIGADTGYTHVAEAFEVPHIALYSTVPAWTRNKYYKYQIAIDPGANNPEFYTFNLGLGDPLRTAEGIEAFSDREKLILKLFNSGVKVQEAAKELNVDKQGAEMELQALLTKKEALQRQQSKALSSITPEMVFEKVEKILDGGLQSAR